MTPPDGPKPGAGGRAPRGGDAPVLNPQLREILCNSFFIRTTMIRRRSGTARTVETTFVWDGSDRIVLSGYPGKRDWVANMAANPQVTVHTVEGDVLYDIPGAARVLRNRDERVPHLLRFIEHWVRRPGYARWQINVLLSAIRLNRWLRLPWWGPFIMARRILDRMPCVEIQFVGEPRLRRGSPPLLTEPEHDRP